MWSAALFVALATVPGADIAKEERELQESVFSSLWNEDFEWRVERLPKHGGVPEERIPYSGHMYLDKDGGTAHVMRKYDLAVNNDTDLPATAWEYKDTSQAYAHTTRVVYYGFGRFRRAQRVSVSGVNAWYGHCNGWSSAAIRHAEPQHTVRAFGGEFSPSDIKAMLAEIYMYNDHSMLAGFEKHLNPGILHAILANWIGRGEHAVVMDADPGKEKWNYPVHSFKSKLTPMTAREIDVRTTLGFVKDSADGEHDKSPKLRKEKFFHYALQVNRRGEITGGYYYTDSDRIDFLWVPLKPKLSGKTGNERGNPHIDVDKVLRIWRQSVPVKLRRKWKIVDPADKDRSLIVSDPNRILPRRIRVVAPKLSLDSLLGKTE